MNVLFTERERTRERENVPAPELSGKYHELSFEILNLKHLCDVKVKILRI